MELRGFEPLTPSMRTERASSYMRFSQKNAQVTKPFCLSQTASDRAWRRIAAPNLLPESDAHR